MILYKILKQFNYNNNLIKHFLIYKEVKKPKFVRNIFVAFVKYYYKYDKYKIMNSNILI